MPTQTLTIELDDQLIHAAQEVAAQHHTTLGDLVSAYLKSITTAAESDFIANLPPLTRAASGILKDLPDRPYRELIEEAIIEKYG